MLDKSSSAELSEAINSIFRWYRKAAKCDVYLSDVSVSGSWDDDFRGSKWFTRGWTLQELLAPASVEVFSREGEQLGDKKRLETEIHEITGIAVDALRGGPLSDFKVILAGYAQRPDTPGKLSTHLISVLQDLTLSNTFYAREGHITIKYVMDKVAKNLRLDTDIDPETFGNDGGGDIILVPIR